MDLDFAKTNCFIAYQRKGINLTKGKSTRSLFLLLFKQRTDFFKKNHSLTSLTLHLIEIGPDNLFQVAFYIVIKVLK